MVSRVPTGIPGLDELIGGGLVQKSTTIVEGGPGSGKSIFCMQFLVAGLLQGESCLFISFEETTEHVLQDLRDFPWDLQKSVDSRKLQVTYYTPEQVNQLLETGGGLIHDQLEGMNARRLVIDSLTAFSLLYPRELERRRALFSLFEAVRRWGCTSLMTLESDPEREERRALSTEFEADSVILLYNQKREHLRERSLEVLKMRGSAHTNRILPMKITSSGILVYPKESVF